MARTRDQSASAVALRAVAYCRGAIGTPYVWGGTTPNGYDCSGLVWAAYDSSGQSIPRTSEEQWAAGFMDVSWGEWAPGDLIFSQWPGDGASPGHVVIYEGDGWTIAAPHTGVTVEREPVSTFQGRPYVGSKRPAPIKGSAQPGGGSPAGGDSPGGSGSSLGGAAGLAVAGLTPVIIVGALALVLVGAVLLFKSRRGAPPAEGDVSGG